MWLMAFGLIHAYLLLSPIDILFIYGILGLLIYPLRNVSPRRLLVTACLGLLIGMVASTVSLYVTIETTSAETVVSHASSTQMDADDPGSLPAELQEADLSEQQDKEAADDLLREWAVDITDRRAGYFYNVVTLAQDSLSNHTVELLTRHFLDVGVAILIGMALLKLGFMTGQLSNRFYLTALLLFYGTGLTLNGLEIGAELASAQGEDVDAGWTTVTYDVSRILVALGHLSLIIVLCKVKTALIFTGLLQATGRLALTNYVVQTVILTLLFFGHGLGWYGIYSHEGLLMIGLCIGAIQLILSKIYLHYFQQGPLEWLIRRLTMWDHRPTHSPT